MIVMRVSDGLGNQMFQYALGKKLSVKHNCKVKFDLDWYKNREKHGGTDREFTLNQFNIEFEEATQQDIEEALLFYTLTKPVIDSSIPSRFPSMTGKILNYYQEIQAPSSDDIDWAYRRKFDDAILNVRHGYLDGYWQAPQYFADIRETLRQDFSICIEERHPELLEKITNSTAVGLHIRRGDFIHQGPGQGNVLPQKYYNRAISAIQSNYSDINLFVFSDEPMWAMDNRQFDLPTAYVPVECNTSETEDLYLMSLCDHNIMANSTFSWWSAWLNDNPEKHITVPTPWKPQPQGYPRGIMYEWDLIPEDWEIIDWKNS